MQIDLSLKKELYEKCLKTIDDRLLSIESMLKELDNSSSSETKSSMGDKYETSREMIQLERNKLHLQMEEISKQKKVLDQLTPLKPYREVQLGTLVRSSAKNFFISVSLGSITVNNIEFICISPVAPLSALLLGKKVGEKFNFAGKSLEILDVC